MSIMVRRLGVVLIWVVATLVATTVALAAVRSVAGQVVDEPGSPLLVATSSGVLGDGTTTTAAATTTTSRTPPTVVPDDGLIVTSISQSNDGDDSEQGVSSGTNPTTAPPSGSTTTTTAASAPTTTTQAPAESQTKTYQLVGGWVRITYGQGVVTLSGAGPNAGYSMDVEHDGPEEVKVEFRKDELRSEFKAEWSDGELDVEIDEGSGDGGDDD